MVRSQTNNYSVYVFSAIILMMFIDLFQELKISTCNILIQTLVHVYMYAMNQKS